MTPSPDVAAKHQVAETSLLFLHAQMVDYNLRGHGAKFFDPPSAQSEQTSSPSPISSPTAAAVASAKRKRLEALGQDVGSRLAERHAHYRENLDQGLDMVKFICKDFWESTFGKQIDVLRTNHRGLYVLTDNHFHWLASVSRTPHHAGGPEDYVVFPCGVICGALTRLGLRCRVTVDLFPCAQGFRCSFNVQLIEP